MRVFWSVDLFRVEDERVHFYADSKSVDVCEVEYIEFVHERCCMCSCGGVVDKPDDFLVSPD
jgi:hypothetical protein